MRTSLSAADWGSDEHVLSWARDAGNGARLLCKDYGPVARKDHYRSEECGKGKIATLAHTRSDRICKSAPVPLLRVPYLRGLIRSDETLEDPRRI